MVNKNNMENREYFWTMKNGEKINVDDMTESHLRNTLKMIMRNYYDRQREDRKFGVFDETPYCDDWMWK